MIKWVWAEDRNSSKECLSNPWISGWKMRSCFYGNLTWLAKRVLGSSLAFFHHNFLELFYLNHFILSPSESLLMKSCQTGGVAKICQQHPPLVVVFLDNREHYETYWDRSRASMEWNLSGNFSWFRHSQDAGSFWTFT